MPVPSELVVSPAAYHAANGSMNVWLIILFATIGAGIWNCILAALGWYMQSIVPEGQFNDKLTQYGHYISIVAIILLAIGIAVICHKRKEVRNASLMQKAKNDIDQFLSVIRSSNDLQKARRTNILPMGLVIVHLPFYVPIITSYFP